MPAIFNTLVVHRYLEGRLSEIESGSYPKHHLWGLEAFEGKTELAKTKGNSIVLLLGKCLKKIAKGRFGDTEAELAIIVRRNQPDLIYVASGHLFFIPILRRLRIIKAKLVTWVFRKPPKSPWWKLQNLHLSGPVARGFDGILCLTRKAESDFKDLAPDSHVRFVPWGVDTKMFNPSPVKQKTSDFYLAIGKTERDYETFLNACGKTKRNFRIIAPREVAQGRKIPSNVRFVECSTDPPDKAISYEELRAWYGQAKAICIPLHGDPDDTCGYTNLLEAMAMGKPVLMTKSGCLDLDIEKLGFGYWVKAQSADSWIKSLEKLESSPTRIDEMGSAALSLVRSTYNLSTFNKEVTTFILQVFQKQRLSR
ncbi:MAG: hypothetical protein CMI31_06340 [Opitutae bacterium]|nr:hypothetical protein [Opitutae bacterium]